MISIIAQLKVQFACDDARQLDLNSLFSKTL